MLGLPSTTEVGRKLPKEAFYRNLKLTTKQKDSFVHGVERITILNSIKETTVHIPEGDSVKEVMVVGIELRREDAANTVIDEIAKANPHKLVFLCHEPGGRACLAVRFQGVRFGEWSKLDELNIQLTGDNLDETWESIVSQIVFGDTGMKGKGVRTRIELVDRIAALKKLVDDLDAKCRRARQIGKKNEFFAQMRAAEEQLEQARKELV